MKIFFSFFIIFLLSIFWPSQVLAKIELLVDEVPSEVSLNHPFTAKITLSGAESDTPYFIRGAFAHPQTTRYFGLTQNHQLDWKQYDSDPSQFFKIQGDGEYHITFQLDKASSLYSPQNNTYEFKVGRFTQGGSHTWSDTPAFTLTVSATSPSPTHSPSPAPTPTFTPQVTNTPKSPTPTIFPSIGSVQISEIYACQTSESLEWVELFNTTTQDIHLTDWLIRDSSSTQKALFSKTIPANGYTIVYLTSPFLNNSGDTIRLLDSSFQIHEQLTYQGCTSSTSWIKHEGSWVQTSSITPEAPNILSTLPSPLPSPSQNLTSTQFHPQTNTPSEHSFPDLSESRKSDSRASEYMMPAFQPPENQVSTQADSSMPPSTDYYPPTKKTKKWIILYTSTFTGITHLASALILYEKLHGFSLPSF